MRTNNFLLIALLLIGLVLILSGASPTPALGAGPCTSDASWVQTPYGLTVLHDFTVEGRCIWDAHSKDSLQRSGACSLPKQHNDLIVLAHNWWCDRIMCHYDTKAGGVFAWPALSVGESISLCANGALYQGKVLSVLADAGGQGISPQSEFVCPTGSCGTLTTCAGML